MRKLRMIKKNLLLMAFVGGVGLSLFLAPAPALSRDNISIIGSSTVYPFSTVVAERFGKYSSFRAPKVESLGTGGGFKLFCSGIDANSSSIVNASRRVALSEFRKCSKNGVSLIEFMFGWDGIVLVNSKAVKPLRLSEELIFAALAADNGFGKKPDTWASAGELVKSGSALPDIPIHVLGPPPTSGTRDSFVELIMEKGAEKLSRRLGWGWDKKTLKRKAGKLREDGAFVDSGEMDNVNIQKVMRDPGRAAIMGFSFLDENIHAIQGASLNGAEPTFENIASGDYPAARPLYFYVKKEHLSFPVAVAGNIQAYISEFISKKAIGEEGYLVDKGLIPLTEEEFKIQFKKLKSLPVLTENDVRIH